MVDLDELERLEREATRGPWEADTEEVGDCVVWGPAKDGEEDSRFVSNIGRSRIGAVGVAFDHDADDCRLIAAARNALPDLIAELRTLRARMAEMERDARLGAVVREAVERMESDHVAGHYRWDGSDEIIIDEGQLDVLRAIADALRAEEPEPIYDVGMDDGLEREEIEVCGQRCDHGSECLALPGHEGGHETQHGCVFYDGAEEGGEHG